MTQKVIFIRFDIQSIALTRKAPSTWREGDKMTFEEAERGIICEISENNLAKKEEQIQMSLSLNKTGTRLDREAIM